MPNEVYDKMNEYYSDIIDDKFNEELYGKQERLVELQQIKDRLKTIFSNGNGDVLELASGGGYWTEHLASYYQRVVALDQNVTALRNLIKHKTLVNVISKKVNLLDIEQLDQETQAYRFTGCFASCFISHILRDELTTYLNDFIELLSPNNLPICFIDSRAYDKSKVLIYPEDHRLKGNQYQIRTMKDGSEVEVIKNFYDAKDWINILDEINCKIVEYREWDIYYLVKFQLR